MLICLKIVHLSIVRLFTNDIKIIIIRRYLLMNNQVTLVGCINSDFTYDHEILGENFFRVLVTIKRDSGTNDILPVIVSERLIDVRQKCTGKYIHIEGQFRSYNKHDTDKTRVILYVFAISVELLNEADNVNDILLEGTICKPPIYRETPQGRQIADIMLAVKKGYGKTDYIPCIAWGRNALYLNGMPVGTHVRLIGRVQSREYSKNGEIRTAYEVSASLIEYL